MASKKLENHEPEAEEERQQGLPPGLKLLLMLEGHTADVYSVMFDPQGNTLASGSRDRKVKLWDVRSGKLLLTLDAHEDKVYNVAFDSRGEILASAGSDTSVKLWNAKSGDLLHKLEKHDGPVYSVAFDPRSETLASVSHDSIFLWDVVSGKPIRKLEGHRRFDYGVAFDPKGETVAGSSDKAVSLWDVGSGKLLRTLEGHEDSVHSMTFDSLGETLASASADRTVKIWDVRSGKLLRTLEGHTSFVDYVVFSRDGSLLASQSNDDTIRLWNCKSWETVAVLPSPKSEPRDWVSSVAFHPALPMLATAHKERAPKGLNLICLWELDFDALLRSERTTESVCYKNAKVVLVGDSGVGKSGLALRLATGKFSATESTHGRHVWQFDSREAPLEDGRKQARETMLWDLAGQPGYRVIHQLHLNEIAVALVVIDARSETDPLAGVRHWERALRLARQRQGTSAVPMKKFLVSARNDRGGVSLGEDRLQAILAEHGFDSYFKTSAKEGWQVEELRAAIEQAIAWDELPEVVSSQLFTDIKSFLLEAKKTGQLLGQAGRLYDEFARQHPDTATKVTNLRDQFDTCIGRLENRDLIRRLTFGGHVLLQPELLDAYCSAMVNKAKEEPDGLGSLAEEVALAGGFFVPKEQKVSDPGQEQLLLHATVEELVRHDLALRENADDGRYLVFPSQFNRDYEDAPEPKGKAMAITFDGPVQSLYSTLAVRLGHSGLFTTGRTEMWRNAAVFDAKAGGKCGLFLHEFAEGRGRLILFFPDERSTVETRFHFEEYVLAHTKRRALDGTVELVRFFVCADCGDPVPDSYVKRLREKGKAEFNCPCGGMVSLAEPKERIHFGSKVEAMDRSADRQRNFDAFVMSAKGETSTQSFQDWAGGEQVTLAIVFTDVVGSTALGEELRDDGMNQVRRSHFAQSRGLIEQFHGREIKTIGDSFMAAFKNACEALDYARALQGNTGHPQVHIRAGIHIGPMHVEEGDVFGGTVNFAARVVGAIKDDEIWLSDRAKEDIDRAGSKQHKKIQWARHEGVTMKGFSGKWTLWQVTA